MGAVGTPSGSSAGPSYYEPDEVDAYVAQATRTIRTLQARLRQAQQRLEDTSGHTPEGSELSTELRRAEEAADRTIADAHARAAAIIRSAETHAAATIDAAHLEARRLVDGAVEAAAAVFEGGESRLLAAVTAFVEGSDILRAEMARLARNRAVRVRP